MGGVDVEFCRKETSPKPLFFQETKEGNSALGDSYYLPLFFWPSSTIAFSSRQIIYVISRHCFLSFDLN
jgi:hypothetical protein